MAVTIYKVVLPSYMVLHPQR